MVFATYSGNHDRHTALRLPLPLQEIRRPQDRGAGEAAQPQHIFIGRDDEIRPGLQGAFEDAIIRLILLDHIQVLRRRDKPGKPEDLLFGILEPVAILIGCDTATSMSPFTAMCRSRMPPN